VRKAILERIKRGGAELHSSTTQDPPSIDDVNGTTEIEGESCSIKESDSEDEGEYSFSIDENGEKSSIESLRPTTRTNTRVRFSAYEVANAFSHFSYVVSWEKRLICDIQGVYDAPTNCMLISDPAVHYYNRKKEYRKNVHGRADLGYRGIKRFVLTHECSELCKLVIHGLRPVRCVGRSEKKRALELR
jgi:Alpha-kinase family